MKELFSVKGIVTKGQGQGKLLGFPTANIPLVGTIPEGIYAGSVEIDGNTYYSASFVGSAKTFQRTDVKVESFIFDFADDIYGKSITVRLYKKIRDNKKFASVEELVDQIKKDVEAVRQFFSLQ